MSQYRFQRYILNNFLAPAQILKIVLKRSFSNDRYRHFARGMCTTAKDTQYSRPFSSPSNRAYRALLRSSVLEQSTQDRSEVAPFFDPVNFPGANVKPMANNETRDHVPTAACLSQGVLILIQYIPHPRLSHAKY